MAFETKQINGLYVDHAPANGPKILFVHGASAGAWNWEKFLPYFSEAGYDSYAMSLRGHAPNPELPELGKVMTADYVQDVRGVVEELGEVILVGHSMGGAVAQIVAQDVPLKAAVFASAGPVAGVKFQQPSMNIWFILHIIKSIPAMVRKKALKPGKRVLKTAVLNRIPEQEQDAMVERFVPESGAVGVEVLKGTISADLSNVKCPRLVISGTDDQTSLIEMQREIAAQHKADLIELEGHGHMFMLEPGWEACAQKLMDWLQSQGIKPAQSQESTPA